MKKVKVLTSVAVVAGIFFFTTRVHAGKDSVNGSIDSDIYAPSWCVKGGGGACRICQGMKLK
jgi:hypothetical protein